jgi:hypothetical protein
MGWVVQDWLTAVVGDERKDLSSLSVIRKEKQVSARSTLQIFVLT